MSLVIVRGGGGTRGQGPLAPDSSFSLLLLCPWVKLVEVIASGPQSRHMDGFSSLLTAHFGTVQVTALGPASVSREDCLSEDGVMNPVIFTKSIVFRGLHRSL